MTTILISMCAVGLFVWIGWRLVSRRRSLPCPSWLGWLLEIQNPFLKASHAGTVMEHLDLEPGMTVLDVGCGPGRLTVPMALAVGPKGSVTALDIQPKMLDRAREKARKAGLDNIRFLEAGAGSGKLEKDRYDRAVLVTVLGEIPDRHAAMKEIFSALKPSGMLAVTEIIADPHFQSRKKILDLAVPIGFREKNFFGNKIAFTLLLEK
jgi:2-polyprenyl-3-methyl-5-hydroxy-6-metoxy-1,4-benzoquinol methylase